MDHIQELQRKRQEKIDHIRSTFTPTTNVETLGEITAEQLSVLEKAKKIAVFTPEAIKQIEIALNKAEDTGFWKGEKVTKGTVDKAKKAIEKLEKKVVTDKNGGTKTVYISVKNETKAHHKMSKEELMEHHSSKELHNIADNYSKSHADVKSSVEKNGAADDSYKSQGATHKRDDVASSEQYYMHIKGAAYEKEKSEGKAQEKATKEVNQPVEIEEDTVEKGELSVIEKAFQDLSGSSFSNEPASLEKRTEITINGQVFVKGEDDDVEDFLEKAKKDLTKLTQRRIVDKNGVGRIVWVKTGEDGKETDFESGHKVSFEHKGEKKSGTIKNLKHSKDDQYGTAEVHDEQGNKYSKSLLTLNKHDKGEEKPDKVKINSPNLTSHSSIHGKTLSVEKVTEHDMSTGKVKYLHVKDENGKMHEVAEEFTTPAEKKSMKDAPVEKTGYGETGKVSKDGTKSVLTPNGDFQKVDAKTGKKVEEKPIKDNNVENYKPSESEMKTLNSHVSNFTDDYLKTAISSSEKELSKIKDKNSLKFKQSYFGLKYMQDELSNRKEKSATKSSPEIAPVSGDGIPPKFLPKGEWTVKNNFKLSPTLDKGGWGMAFGKDQKLRSDGNGTIETQKEDGTWVVRKPPIQDVKTLSFNGYGINPDQRNMWNTMAKNLGSSDGKIKKAFEALGVDTFEK